MNLRPLLLLAVLVTNPAWAKPPAAAHKPAPAPAAPAFVDQAPAELRPRIFVEVQCITLPQPRALPLIRRLRSDSAEVRKQALAEVEQSLDQGTAKLAGWPQLSILSGNKGVSDAIEEIRFPTEFQPGSASIYISDAAGVITKQPTQLRGTDLEPVGTAFETRNLGFMFEAEPTLSPNGQSVDLAFVVQHVQLKSIDRWTIEHERTVEKTTDKVTQPQPRFSVFKAQSILHLASGDHKLVGVFKSNESDDVLELFILGMEVEKVK